MTLVNSLRRSFFSPKLGCRYIHKHGFCQISPIYFCLSNRVDYKERVTKILKCTHKGLIGYNRFRTTVLGSLFFFNWATSSAFQNPKENILIHEKRIVARSQFTVSLNMPANTNPFGKITPVILYSQIHCRNLTFYSALKQRCKIMK